MSAVEQERRSKLDRALNDHILKVMMHLNQRGFGTSEILDALERVCRQRRDAYDEDPDPAEDPDAAENLHPAEDQVVERT